MSRTIPLGHTPVLSFECSPTLYQRPDRKSGLFAFLACAQFTIQERNVRINAGLLLPSVYTWLSSLQGKSNHTDLAHYPILQSKAQTIRMIVRQIPQPVQCLTLLWLFRLTQRSIEQRNELRPQGVACVHCGRHQ